MTTERELEAAQAVCTRLEGAISEVIVGQRDVIRAALITLLCAGNLLLEGVPGLGKTLLVRSLASALSLRFSRIQFTPDLMPADILGTDIITKNGGERRFTYSPGPIFAHVVIVLATQNPIEMEGTYPLPEAQVDRFLLKALVDTPSLDELVAIAERNTEGEGLVLPSPVATGEEILACRRVVREVPIAEELRRYIGRLVLATHPGSPHALGPVNEYVEYGASPRAAIALVRAAKTHAFLAGEPNVRRADIETVFPLALVHRVILNFKGEAEGIVVSDLLRDVWEKTVIV
jgi:MoxR-like ATPase